MSGMAYVGRGLLQGYLTGENMRRQEQQDERQQKLAEQQGAINGLTIQQKQNEVNDYEAGAGLRDQKRQAEEEALKEAQRQREYDSSLVNANKIFETTGKLDGYLAHYNSMVSDGQQATDMSVDPQSGRVDVQMADGSGHNWTRSFDSVGAMTKRLEELRSPEAIRAAQAAKEAEARKIAEEQRLENRDNRKADRDHRYAVELTGLRADTAERLLSAREKFKAGGKTGKMISQADRGKLVLQTAKELGEDPNYVGRPVEERIQAAQKIVESLYAPDDGDGPDSEDAADEASETPAANGITRPPVSQPTAKPVPTANASKKPSAFTTKGGATLSQDQYNLIVQKAKAANPNVDPKAVENAVRQRYGFPPL